MVVALAMVVIGVIMVVGSLGEALAPASPDVPRTVQIIGGLVDVSASVLLTLLAVWDVARRLRHAEAQPAAVSGDART